MLLDNAAYAGWLFEFRGHFPPVNQKI
jgi:hypothetical protein